MSNICPFYIRNFDTLYLNVIGQSVSLPDSSHTLYSIGYLMLIYLLQIEQNNSRETILLIVSTKGQWEGIPK